MFDDEIVTIPVGSIVIFSTNIVCEVRDVLSPHELIIAGYEPGTLAYVLYGIEDGVPHVATDDEIIMLY